MNGQTYRRGGPPCPPKQNNKMSHGLLKARKQIRLKTWNYAQYGYYFITICVGNRKNLLGHIVPVGADPRVRPNKSYPKIVLSKFGQIVDNKILELKKYEGVDVDLYCIMPNHVHLILIVSNIIGSARAPRTRGTPTVGEYIKRFKTLTTNIYIENVKINNWPPFNKKLWQRNYFEHIVRNERDLQNVRSYILYNPLDVNPFLFGSTQAIVPAGEVDPYIVK